MTETEQEKLVPAGPAETELYRLLHPAFDRFERRHYVGLAASIALHLAILMGVRWAIHPIPPRPVVVDVELIPAEQDKASPRYSMAKVKPTSRASQTRLKIKPPKPPKLAALSADEEMTMQVIQAAPAKTRKRGIKGKGSAPAVALPGTSLPVSGTSQTIPGQAPAAKVFQQAVQQGAVRPRVASAGQQASSRSLLKSEAGVESKSGPALIASNVPAAQSLAPEYRHSSKPGGDFSSQGGAARTAMGGGPRSEDTRPYSLQASGSGAAALPVKGLNNGALVSTPAPGSTVRSGGLTPTEVRTTGGQLASAAGAAISPDQAQGAGKTARGASVSSAANTSRSSGMSPTEIRTSGGQLASAAGSAISPDQAQGAGKAARGASVSSAANTSRSSGMSPTEIRTSGGQLASATGSAIAPAKTSGTGGGGNAVASSGLAADAAGRGLPGEGRAAASLQGSGTAGTSRLSGGGTGAGDFSLPGSGASRTAEEGISGGGQLIASAGSGGSLSPEIRSMSAAFVPDRESDMVSQVWDDSSAAPMQRVEVQAITHHIDEDRYQTKSLKVNSPKTFCELPLMIAGFDRKPLPEGLASIMGSESAMVMEAPPELLPGNLQPTYPPAALLGNHKGIVTIRAQVLSNGRVGESFIKYSSGAVVLDQAAISTVRGWRFKPARRNGEAISAWVNIPIEYRNPTLN